MKGERLALELRMGAIVVNAQVRGGSVVTGTGSLVAPDLVIEGGHDIRALMAGEVTPKEALKNGSVRVQGKRALLDRFAALFQI